MLRFEPSRDAFSPAYFFAINAVGDALVVSFRGTVCAAGADSARVSRVSPKLCEDLEKTPRESVGDRLDRATRSRT